jgi:hypothetical protein
MRNLRVGSEQDLVWNWAKAEIESTRHAQYYSLPLKIQNSLRDDNRGQLSSDEWAALAEQVFAVRGPLLAGLRRLNTQWHVGILPYDELASLRIMGWSGFTSWAPSGQFDEFVRTVDLGQPPVTKEWLSYYHKLRNSFDQDKMKGSPILVSKDHAGPYIIREGYGRLSVLLSLFQEKQFQSRELKVIIGICDRLDEWYLGDNKAWDCLFLG